MRRSVLAAVTMMWLSLPVWAAPQTYEGRIEGMVCAFCAYSVGRTIGDLPGVQADSVDVDLETGVVRFSANDALDFASVSGAFTDSGFTLVALEPVPGMQDRRSVADGNPVAVFEMQGLQPERFAAMLEALGGVAAAQRMRLVIEAPDAVEMDLLKPILMGRKPAINVRFVATHEDSIRLSMYSTGSAYQ